MGKQANHTASSPLVPPHSSRCVSKRATDFGRNDIHSEFNPYEAGTEFAVKMNKGDFIGKSSLQAAQANGISRKLSCITLNDSDRVLMGKEPIMSGDRVLGYVTSANYGHFIGRGIAYGYLPNSHATPGTPVEIVYFGEHLQATVQNDPLYDPTGKRLKS